MGRKLGRLAETLVVKVAECRDGHDPANSDVAGWYQE
jgi:hypothetical protein